MCVGFYSIRVAVMVRSFRSVVVTNFLFHSKPNDVQADLI